MRIFMETDVKISIVVPVYNEEDSVPLLNQAIIEAMVGHDYEVLYVDDGSTDESIQVLEGIAKTNPKYVRVIEFRRNFGQTAAMAAG